MLRNLLIGLFLGVTVTSGAICPPATDLLPCTCNEAELAIKCDDIRGRFDIKTLFDQISPLIDQDVVFNKLSISGTGLLEIPSDSIQTLKFLAIVITSNANLEYISPQAFNATTTVTTQLSLPSNFLSNQAPYERDIFDFLNQFTNVESIRLADNRITSVPDNGFGPLTALKELDLGSNAITSIGTSAFSQLTNLGKLGLLRNKISPLGISPDTFKGIGEKVNIDLTFTDIDYLPEDAFRSLLDNAERVAVGGRSCGSSGACSYQRLICDMKALWICQNPTEYYPKLSGFLCLDGNYSDIWSYCAARH